MPFSSHTVTASVFACLVGIAACSSEVVNLERPFDKPHGCAQSFCDVHYDRCYGNARSGSSSGCGECASLCANSADPASCVATCLDACQGSSLPSVDHCSRSLQECRSTNVNRGCADGVDKYSIPHAVPKEKPAFMPPTEPHQGACSPEEMMTFALNCVGPKRCRGVSSACLACLVVDQGADRWGPYVRRPDGRVMRNRAGCIASLGDPACAEKVFIANECRQAACPHIDRTCFDLATTVSCAAEEEAAKCEDKLRDDPAFSACFVGPVIDGSPRDPVTRFFCGK